MAEDLRRTVAKGQLEQRNAPQIKSYDEPDMRYPVIIGGDSMFRTPEDLRDMYQFPSVPPVTQTTEATYPGDQEQEQDQEGKETLYTTDLDRLQYFAVEDSTEGVKVLVWFQGRKQRAWLPKYRNTAKAMPNLKPWHAAVWHALREPEVRCPVIIGGDSMFRTPEDLRDFLQLPSVPPLTQTTETTSYPRPGDQEQDQKGKETLCVSYVNRKMSFKLEDLTEGVDLLVWFEGKKRSTWLPKSRKTEGSAKPSEN